MRLTALLAIAALPLSACAQEEEGQAPETPVVESEVAPTDAADEAELTPGEPSLADPAPGSVTSPAPEANPATPAPGSADAEEVGEQYQDFVGEQPAQ